MKEKYRVLITGGAGFIGSHVARETIALGMSVVVLDDLSGGSVENLPDQAIFEKGSILDEALLKSLFDKYEFDYVIHLAAYAAEGLSHFIKRFNYNNNLIGSVNLINESVKHEVKCFVFTSSIAVYGTNQLPMTEDLVPQPEDPYAIAKLAVEQELAVTQKMFGLNHVIFRPHNVYGEFQNIGDRYRNVIGIFMNNIMKGEPLTVFGDGNQTRAFTYVGDIAPIIVKSILTPSAYNQCFNIGSDRFTSLNILASEVMKAMGKKVPIQTTAPRYEVTHAYCSHEKIKQFLGEISETELSDGLKRMALWAQTNGARASKSFEVIELEKNLPSIWRKATTG